MPDRSATTQLGTVTSESEPLTRLLTRAARAMAVQVDAALKPEGLNLDQWLVIDALARRRGLTMAELSARTMATAPTLTRVVDRLVSNAIVYREVDADDRRKVRAYLSPRGRLLYRRLAAKVGEVEQDLLDRCAGEPTVLLVLRRLAGTVQPPE